MLQKLTSLGSAAKGNAKGRAQRDDRETLREVMHSNALGVAALAARVEELELELKTTKAALLRVRVRVMVSVRVRVRHPSPEADANPPEP